MFKQNSWVLLEYNLLKMEFLNDCWLNSCIFYEQHSMLDMASESSSVQSHVGGFYKSIQLKGN